MKAAAASLVGKHDFAAFTDRNEDQSTVRNIYDIRIEEEGSKVTIIYEGNGFMYHMVRILTGTILEAATGKRTIEETAALLDGGERWQAGFLAPACGLTLKEVYYG
jgi:tRNA pseudouridine38-40 synthase